MAEAIRLHTEVTGERPTGWYTGRTSVNTVGWPPRKAASTTSPTPMTTTCPTGSSMTATARDAAAHHPLHARRQRHALRHAAGLQLRRPVLRLSQGHLRHALCRGHGRAAAMMNIGLHCRLVGRPGRAAALQALHRLRQGARQGLDRAPHRHRRHWRETPSLPGAGAAALAHGRARTFVDAIRRHLRAFALDRRARLRARARPGARHRRRPAQCALPRLPLAPARTSGSACSTPTPISPASWRRPSG